MSGHDATVAGVVVDGWTAVGAFVVASVAVAGYVSEAASREAVAAATRRRGVGPLAGALLGLVPGCGGAVAVATLYGRSVVGLGTVVAALAATAGDAVFVLLAVAPEAALGVTVAALPTAVLSGVVVDAFAPGVGRVERALGRRRVADGGGSSADAGTTECHGTHTCARDTARSDGGAGARVTAAALSVWYLAVGIGLVAGLAGVAGVSGVVPEPVVAVASFVGVGGALAVALVSDSVVVGGRWQPLVRTTVTASPTVVWAVGGLAAVAFLPEIARSGVSAVAGEGALAPVAGSLFGLLPGCGPHVAFAAAYGEGAVSFAALVAVTVAQDGDAIFPLVAVDRVAAVLVTVYTTVPAVAAGLAVHALATVCGVPVSASG